MLLLAIEAGAHVPHQGARLWVGFRATLSDAQRVGHGETAE